MVGRWPLGWWMPELAGNLSNLDGEECCASKVRRAERERRAVCLSRHQQAPRPVVEKREKRDGRVAQQANQVGTKPSAGSCWGPTPRDGGTVLPSVAGGGDSARGVVPSVGDRGFQLA